MSNVGVPGWIDDEPSEEGVNVVENCGTIHGGAVAHAAAMLGDTVLSWTENDPLAGPVRLAVPPPVPVERGCPARRRDHDPLAHEATNRAGVPRGAVRIRCRPAIRARPGRERLNHYSTGSGS